MDYKITQTEDEEFLELVGKEERLLRGFQQFNSTDNPDMIVSDVFHIVRRVSAEKTKDGLWREVYEIDRRYQIIDRIPQIGAMNETNRNELLRSEKTLSEMDARYEKRIEKIEDELKKKGGET